MTEAAGGSLTAVRFRDGANDASLLEYGAPIRWLRGVATFAADQVVAFSLLLPPHPPQLFVLRTLPTNAQADGARIPGVFPRARLLTEVSGVRRVALVRKMFAYFARSGVRPETLSLGFWIRLDAVLSGRVPPAGAASQLEALLRDESRG